MHDDYFSWNYLNKNGKLVKNERKKSFANSQ